MSDNPLDRIPAHDRLSIRAVIVEDGQDPGPALSEAGIFDPIAVPLVFGEAQPDGRFGDGITPNLTAVLEYDQPAGQQDDSPEHRADTSEPDPVEQASRATDQLPAAYGIQPLAPVRSNT